MRVFKKYFDCWLINLNSWTASHYLQLAIFNVFLILLFLLKSAGYFHPFFIISINFIVLAGLIAAVLLLGAKSRALFLVALVFWVFAGFLRIIKINVWAERTAVYAYQALVIGVFMSLIENVSFRNKKNKDI